MTSLPRVAVVGCGHGSLNEIYEEIEARCIARGWDTVDVVIIGGDFQSLRNANDAACISVPAKYRKIGDFHEYYSGARVAPYLTIFCGGNHEASNYLFELFYGGWVAPNIYYMGAANVLRLGPLRIAGMSGIWKGYDYRKAHSERLPYTYDDLSSIYHIREVDVRKFLHLRTQVDIGLSHDWPRGIEAFGDSAELFRKKGHLRDDSTHDRLGSQAAREVLEYLRPAYWFSAHLHVKYLATMAHDGAMLRKLTPGQNEPLQWAFEATPKSPTKTVFDNRRSHEASTPEHPPVNKIGFATGSDEQRMQAWRNFGAVAREQERAANQKFMADFKARQERGIQRTRPVHKLISKNLDGTIRCVSEIGGDEATLDNKKTVHNDDEIELNSNSSSGDKMALDNNETVQNDDEIDLESSNNSNGGSKRSSPNPSSPTDFHETGGKKQKLDKKTVQNDDEIDLASSNGSNHSSPSSKASSGKPGKVPPQNANDAPETSLSQSLIHRAVIDDIRRKLPGSFGRPPASPTDNRSGKKPPPEAVTNLMTKFMALDKPGNRDSAIELVELTPLSEAIDSSVDIARPFRLQYDKEWLAITRAFAEDLRIGSPGVPVPPRLDEVNSLREIKDAEGWVEENVVRRGLLDVPLNFARIAPIYNSNDPIANPSMPMEYPSNQTEDFCQLIGIKNKFSLADEERAARMEAGARRASNNPQGGSGRRNHTRGKRAGRGRGGRGPGKSAKGAGGDAMDKSW